MEAILEGISLSLSVNALLGIIVGVVLGQVLGSIPGLTAAMAVALLVPFSFYFDPWVGIPMMLAMFKGSLFGSSIPAILLRTQGRPLQPRPSSTVTRWRKRVRAARRCVLSCLRPYLATRFRIFV